MYVSKMECEFLDANSTCLNTSIRIDIRDNYRKKLSVVNSNSFFFRSKEQNEYGLWRTSRFSIPSPISWRPCSVKNLTGIYAVYIEQNTRLSHIFNGSTRFLVEIKIRFISISVATQTRISSIYKNFFFSFY